MTHCAGDLTMMRRLVLALVLLVVPSTAMAQGGGRAGMARQPMMAQQNAFQLLLEKKADYKLTEVQIARVDTIARALQQKHEPLVKEMQALMQGGGMRNLTAEQRQGLMTKRQAMQADVEQEMEKLKEILTEEQQKMLTEELARRRRRPPPPNG
jgi:hypothetical protein